jgi:hypothetical protein
MEIKTKHQEVITYKTPENVELRKIKNIVAEVLEQDKKTRNNDTWLILQTLRKLGFKVYIDYTDIKHMPSFETITRSRRYWQNNKNMFLPKLSIGEVRDNNENKFIQEFK